MTWAVVTALVVLPLLAGVLLRVGLARLGGAARAVAVLVLLAPAGLAVALVEPCTLRLTVDDAAWMGLLAALGALLARGGRLPSPVGALKVLVAIAFVLCGLELGCRLLLPPIRPPTFPVTGPLLLPADRGPTFGLQFVGFGDGALARACSLAYPDLAPAEYRARQDAAPRCPVHLLHVGDSLVEAAQVGGPTGTQAFVARLAELLPGTSHVNGGVAGTGTDLQALLLSEWTHRERYDGVVLYVFPLNDLRFLGNRYPCCDGRTVLASREGDAAPRCGPGHLPGCWAQWLGGGAGPYVVRATTPHLALARAINQRLQAKRLAAGTEVLEPSVAWQSLEAVLQMTRDATRAQGLPLAVVLLPERSLLDRSAATCPGCQDWSTRFQEARQRLQDVAARLGLEVWDPTDALMERARTEDAQAWFVPTPRFAPDDVHFGARGHEIVAEWLAERLRTWAPVAAGVRADR